MKGDEKVLEVLNQARTAELEAILQYMEHHYELEDQDLPKLAMRLKAISIEEMKHAEMLAERVLYLEGQPTYKINRKVEKGQEVADMIKTDRELEATAIKMYNDSAKVCDEASDRVSKELFETLLAQEEEHWDQFDNVIDHIEKMGAAYLATLTEGAAE